MLIVEEYADIETLTGTMRLHIFRPAPNGQFAGVAVFTEIYQVRCLGVMGRSVSSGGVRGDQCRATRTGGARFGSTAKP